MTSQQPIAECVVVELREREPIGEVGSRVYRSRVPARGDGEQHERSHLREYRTTWTADLGKLLLAIGMLAGCQRAGHITSITLPASEEVVAIRAASTVREPAPPPKPRFEIIHLNCFEPCDAIRMNDPWAASAATAKCQYLLQLQSARCQTPLVIAFAPIELQPASTARFAFEAGHPATSAWPTAATPWIALDRDGDGAITSGAELFGDSTGDAHDGFEALAALDDNHDGVIDRRDLTFAKLLLWADANSDRRSTPDELRPLASAIESIPLAHDGARGSARMSGGETVEVIDLYLPTAQ